MVLIVFCCFAGRGPHRRTHCTNGMRDHGNNFMQQNFHYIQFSSIALCTSLANRRAIKSKRDDTLQYLVKFFFYYLKEIREAFVVITRQINTVSEEARQKHYAAWSIDTDPVEFLFPILSKRCVNVNSF